MTLDEAIKHCEEVANSNEYQVEHEVWEKGSFTEKRCIECAREHRQLSEWLKDYKRLLKQEPILDKIRAEILDEAISHSGTGEEVIQAYVDGLNRALKIIDKYKYKAESEEK